MGSIWLDQDLNAGTQLKVELREESIRIVDPRGGGLESVTLQPQTRQEAVLMAIAIRKTYKRLEELAISLPDTRRGK